MWEPWKKRALKKEEICLDLIHLKDSYERCKKRGMAPDLERLTDQLQGDALAAFSAKYAVAEMESRKYFFKVYKMWPDCGCGLGLTDPTGRIITLVSASDILSQGITMGIVPGLSLAEENMGTNAAALALLHRQPVIVKGPEHFLRLFHSWYCAAAPIFDTAGTLMGCVIFSTGKDARIIEKLPLVTLIAEQLGGVFPSEETTTEATGASQKSAPHFSERHISILKMVSDGLTSKEIGKVLSISSRTVETHLERMRIRARARTTSQLVARTRLH